MKKNKEKKKENSGKFSNFLKRVFSNRTETFLLALLLVIIFIVLNLAIQEIDLAQIDFTENKVYTLSDASKKAIQDIDTDVKLYFYGFDSNSSTIDLAKQYNKANEKISYEIITQENNPEKIAEYELEEGYKIAIAETSDNHQLINASSEFSTYDYTTGESIDTTEQTLTNAILNLTTTNKPKIYLLEGHKEYTKNEMTVLTTYLENEVYELDTLNLLTSEKVPDDCSVLAIFDPTVDFADSEVTKIQDYINNGGNIVFTKDIEKKANEYPNIQKVLDLYGVSIENGCVMETTTNKVLQSYPTAFIPSVDTSHEITKEIYSDGGQLLMYSAGRLKVKDEDTLNELKVTETDLITSSEDSYFVSDLTSSISTSNGEKGKSVVGAYFVKSLVQGDSAVENTEETKTSKLVIVANTQFISDKTLSNVSSTPIILLSQNKDFMMNSFAYMSKRDNLITIRKDRQSTTYTATAQEDLIVRIIIFAVPVLIIVSGCLVWRHRKRKR